GANVQARVQSSTRPEVVSAVQGLPSSHTAGHAPGLPAVMPLSHDSPVSTTALPHTTGQSESLLWLQPGGQQLSPPAQAVIGSLSQRAVHEAASPASLKRLHSLGAGQVVGHAPGMPAAIALSQVSLGGSTMPLPHTDGQSGSLLC